MIYRGHKGIIFVESSNDNGQFKYYNKEEIKNLIKDKNKLDNLISLWQELEDGSYELASRSRKNKELVDKRTIITEKNWNRSINSKEHKFIGLATLEINDSIIGMIQFSKLYNDLDAIFVSKVIITKDYRGRGYSKRLFKFALDKAMEGFKSRYFSLILDYANDKAHNLYKSIGFEDTSITMHLFKKR